MANFVVYDAELNNFLITDRSWSIQDRQCMHNVTLRRVHETIFMVEKQ
jgi:hypothetical protein